MIRSYNYDLKLLNAFDLRSYYLPLIEKECKQYWRINQPVMSDEIEMCFQWMILEAALLTFKCPVLEHYNNDFAKCVFKSLPSFMLDVEPLMEQTGFYKRRKQIQHIKASTFGEFLMIGALIV